MSKEDKLRKLNIPDVLWQYFTQEATDYISEFFIRKTDVIEFLYNQPNPTVTPINTSKKHNGKLAPHHGEKWTPELENKVFELLKEGKNFQFIAIQLGRSLGSIKAKVRKSIFSNHNEAGYDEVITRYNITDNKDKLYIKRYMNNMIPNSVPLFSDSK